MDAIGPVTTIADDRRRIECEYERAVVGWPIGQECRGGRRTGSEREWLYGDGTDSAQLGIVGCESSLPC